MTALLHTASSTGALWSDDAKKGEGSGLVMKRMNAMTVVADVIKIMVVLTCGIGDEDDGDTGGIFEEDDGCDDWWY